MTRSIIVIRTLLAVTLVTGLAVPCAAQEIKLRISNQLPATQPVSKGLELWKTKMEEAGRGRVRVEVYHNSQLYKDKDVFPAVQAGSVEAGFVIAGQFSAYDQIFDLFDLPLLFPSYDVAVRSLHGDLGRALGERLAKFGVVPLYWPQQGFIEYATTKKPLATAADFKGLKIRAATKGQARMVQLLGSAPTVIAASEVYTALTRGTIDGLSTSLASYYTRKWYEGAPHGTLARFGLIGAVVIINKGVWDRLPADLKTAAQEAARAAEALSNDGIINGQSEFVDALRKHNVQLVEWTPAARGELVELTKPMYEEFYKAVGQPGRDMVQYVRSLK